MRPRALFADADSKEQAARCLSQLKACGVYPSMAVNSGRGHHFYFCTDVPRDQFSMLQMQLIAKFGSDPAVKDLPRVMRLPGTLHLKDPTKPMLVTLLNPPNVSVQRWQLPDLESKLGLSPSIADYDFATFRADPGPPARGLLYPPALFPTKPYVPPAELDDGILGEDCRRHEVDLDPSVLFKECPFLRESYKTGGAGLAQGLWMNSVLAMTFLPHGDELAQKFSAGYSTYTADETDKMYDRKENDAKVDGARLAVMQDVRDTAASCARRASTSVKSSHL